MLDGGLPSLFGFLVVFLLADNTFSCNPSCLLSLVSPSFLLGVLFWLPPWPNLSCFPSTLILGGVVLLVTRVVGVGRVFLVVVLVLIVGDVAWKFFNSWLILCDLGLVGFGRGWFICWLLLVTLVGVTGGVGFGGCCGVWLLMVGGCGSGGFWLLFTCSGGFWFWLLRAGGVGCRGGFGLDWFWDGFTFWDVNLSFGLAGWDWLQVGLLLVSTGFRSWVSFVLFVVSLLGLLSMVGLFASVLVGFSPAWAALISVLVHFSDVNF